MDNVVSLNQWKKEHPGKVIVVVNDYLTVKIVSLDYRTEYSHMCCQREITNREFINYIADFRTKYPDTIVTDIIFHSKKTEKENA